jgi:hypothetical protein
VPATSDQRQQLDEVLGLGVVRREQGFDVREDLPRLVFGVDAGERAVGPDADLARDEEKPMSGWDFRQVAVPPERRGDGFGTPAAWLHTAMVADRLGQVVCSQIWFAI